MTKHNLVETFFSDHEECIDFFIRLKQLMKASDDAKCIAILEKTDDGYYKYTLNYDGKYIGDYVEYFKPSIENFEKFNEGCRILAERLEILLETNDLSKVPENPPAFGDLTHVIK